MRQGAARLLARAFDRARVVAGVVAVKVVGDSNPNALDAGLDALTAFPLNIAGDAGFPKAEVSGGGVPLHELRLDPMESRKAPGVFLCGEIIDALGRIGGCVGQYAFVWVQRA